MLFRYKVQTCQKGSDELEVERGIVGESGYGVAVEAVVKYYGAENIVEISIFECENILSDEEIVDTLAADGFIQKKQSIYRKSFF